MSSELVITDLPSSDSELTGWADIDDMHAYNKYVAYLGCSKNQVASLYPIIKPGSPGLPKKMPLGIIDASREFAPSQVISNIKKWEPDSYFTGLVRKCLYIGHAMKIVSKKQPQEHNCTYYPGVAGDDIRRRGPKEGTKIFVVGKWFTSDDDSSFGRPFSGSRFAYFWKAWLEAKLPNRSSKDLYLTNLIKFSPPLWATKSLPTMAIDDGRYLLFQELLLTKPEWLVILGSEPLKAIYGHKATVTSLSGGVSELALDTRTSEDEPYNPHIVKVIVTDDPAKVNYEPSYYNTLLSSFRMFSTILKSSSSEEVSEEENKDYKAIVNDPQLMNAVDEAIELSKESGYIAIDCEWEGRHPANEGAYLYTFQFSCKPDHARSVFYTLAGGSRTHISDEVFKEQLHRLLVEAKDRGTRIIGHNLKADLLWLAHYGCDLYTQFKTISDPDATYYEGFFDTWIAAQASDESCDKKLELLAAQKLGIIRYDGDVLAWVARYCKENDISKDDLEGYGNCPEDIIMKYGCGDVDVTGQLYLYFNGDFTKGTRGFLDSDMYGHSSRRGFATLMSAASGWAEMERWGLKVDEEAHKSIRRKLLNIKLDYESKIRQAANWPDLNLNSTNQKQALLFDDEYIEEEVVQSVPIDAMRLGLKPYKATKSANFNLWDKAQTWGAKNDISPSPSCDTESLIALASQHPLVHDLYRYQTVNTQLKSLLRPADGEEEAIKALRQGLISTVELENGYKFSKGLMKYKAADGRVRSMFGYAETNRCTSSRPNLQNISDRANELINTILELDPESEDAIVIRNIFVAEEDYYYVTFDLVGAEIAVAAWMSGDKLLIEHAYRNTLPSDHPDYIDLHSDLAVRAFKLDCKPSKDELKKRGYLKYRKAAKPARFGLYYGAGVEKIWRKALEEDPSLSIDDIKRLVDAHNDAYPDLIAYFNTAKKRPYSPGWIKGPFGSIRRFFTRCSDTVMSKQEREAQNVVPQGGVADSISIAIANLIDVRETKNLDYRIVLSVHDSITLEVHKRHLKYVHDVVIPYCAKTKLQFVPCTLDGEPITDRGPYEFALDIDVGKRLGEKLPESVWRSVV